ARPASMSSTATAAPQALRASAMPAPTPWPAPVTSATRPVRSKATIAVSACCGSLGETAGDDPEGEGLVGALEDREDAGVDEVAADRELLCVPHAAVDLHGLAGDPFR